MGVVLYQACDICTCSAERCRSCEKAALTAELTAVITCSAAAAFCWQEGFRCGAALFC